MHMSEWVQRRVEGVGGGAEGADGVCTMTNRVHGPFHAAVK